MKDLLAKIKSLFYKPPPAEEGNEYTEVQLHDVDKQDRPEVGPKHVHTKKGFHKDPTFDETEVDIDLTVRDSGILGALRNLFQKHQKPTETLNADEDHTTIAGKYDTVMLKGKKKPEQKKFLNRFLIYILIIAGVAVIADSIMSGKEEDLSQSEEAQPSSQETAVDDDAAQEDTTQDTTQEEDTDFFDEFQKQKQDLIIIDYKTPGAGLVYNCLGRHWACVNRANYQRCRRGAQRNPPQCRALKYFESHRICRGVQQRQVDKGRPIDFCD